MWSLTRYPFFQTSLRKTFLAKDLFVPRLLFFDTLFAVQKIDEAMMLVSRKNFYKVQIFYVVICFVVKVDHRVWYSFVEHMFQTAF